MKFRVPNSKKGSISYYLLVITIIVITIAMQSIIQYSLKKQNNTALVVNMAGRQRMLSQKILNQYYSCLYDECDFAEMKLSLNKLVQVNNVLQNGDPELGISPLKNEEIKKSFEGFQKHIDFITNELGEFENFKNIPLPALKENINSFLLKMDHAVYQFQYKSEKDIKGIMIIELELAAFSVLILLFEIFFIVKPFIKRITTQKKKLTEIAWHQSHVFDSNMKNIKHLQYVLKIEKNPERKEEIFKFISEELDSLENASQSMVKVLKENENQLGRTETLGVTLKKKYSGLKSKLKATDGGKVRSLK
ncbi:nitrate/nitrite-specific signal transduction histidine kinase [Saonia flava]|uniref:Nitrate/nitrite-specific signal transduction histidine kinase n=1 Tax=Saonia flava TaxID=523696 RepID=A0A846R5D3_9FLAO|nr:type IV pili methyl-accepting chemotaxis transducer N-terminal domain-containing protein [Saonia flava]NJB71989.1 nitrate/nitrite-specific signal transduction histidine kinase [Saonia flava]